MVMQGSAASKAFPERVLSLCDDHGLVAIATDPVSPDPARPAVIMLNAGVLHRVGPHRLHVLLGRELALRGFRSCRIDLSGIGDSRAIAGAATFRESSVADTRTLMDHLASDSATNRFVIFGLCSGADNGLAVAAADPRVVGLILIDAPAYPTLRGNARKLFRMGLRAGIKAVARKLAGAFQQPAGDGGIAPGRQPPPQNEYRELLNRFVSRHVELFFIYSSALHGRYNHVNQLFELFPELRGHVSVEYFGEADHAFTEKAAQRRLIDAVVDWLDRTYS